MIMLYWARVDSKPQRVSKLGIRDGNIVGVDEGFAIHTYGLRDSPGPTIISSMHQRENRGKNLIVYIVSSEFQVVSQKNLS